MSANFLRSMLSNRASRLLFQQRQASGQSTIPEHIRKAQEHFQKDNGIPVYIKGGVGDKILLGITVSLIAVGLSMSINLLYNMALPKKN